MAAAWAEAWRDPRFRLRLALTVPALVAVLALLARFLTFVEARPGAVLTDPVLALLAPRDLTWLTFSLIYLGLAFGVARLAADPRALVVALQAYVLMVIFRMAAMWVTPLEAPPGMIPLHDPLVRLFGPGKLLTKDLFFSGHTSTLFLLALAVPGRRSKALFLFCTAAVGISVLAQHVHYTIDVLAAPFFAYASFRIARLFDGPRSQGPA
ncbi:MAG TPA: phosphatase PAP2-related protein [Thermoanaerobaculia bacterium]|nr:phosphatase PAP2-related protein [Thermoanaerobaculia bacterium]